MGTVDLLLLRFHVAWAQRRNPCRPGATCRHQRRQLQHWARGGGSSTSQLTLQNNLSQRSGLSTPTISKPAAPELLIQGQDGSMTLVQPNLYRTTFENSQPVMVTLNPYSTQLVDNLNKMMGSEQQAWSQQQQQQGWQQQQQHGIQEEVYAYAATDFSEPSAQVRDCRPAPASVKSREYIMAKIADYTERSGNQV